MLRKPAAANHSSVAKTILAPKSGLARLGRNEDAESFEVVIPTKR